MKNKCGPMHYKESSFFILVQNNVSLNGNYVGLRLCCYRVNCYGTITNVNVERVLKYISNDGKKPHDFRNFLIHINKTS